MYDATSLSDNASRNAPGNMPGRSGRSHRPRLQRARGRVRLNARFKDRRTRLADLYQDGCAKVRLPKCHGSAALEAVLLNTAGGLTGGDRLETDFAAGAGTVLNVTTQACERIYRALEGAAQVRTRLRLDDGARLHWLPQETILFDGSRLHRSLDIDLAEDASLLAVEPVVFGRVASGEILGDGLFRESWRVRRAGRLVFADETRLEGSLNDTLSRPAVLAGAKAAATVLMAAPDADALLAPARDMLAPHTAGASAFDGLLLCRIVADDNMALREALIPLLTLLRGGEDLPRAWHL